MSKFLLAAILTIATAQAANAQSFDLSGFDSNVGTLQGPNAAANFALGGNQAQFMTPAQIQQAQIINASQFGNQMNAQMMQAQTQAAAPAAMGAGGAFASTADQGDAGRFSNATGEGSQGVGGYGTARTSTQSPVMQRVGTMGLAPVFGYGAPSVSPGGYVNGINLFGLGTVRLPGTIGLPGGGAIGLPGINYGAINSAIGGP